MDYNQVREEVMGYIERKRGVVNERFKDLEVANVEDQWEQDETDWGGGASTELHEEYADYIGKGNYGKGGGKGGWAKGSRGKGEGYQKASVKGEGKSKGKGWTGKGVQGSGFQGNCHWCGVYGHSQSRCRHKDEYMNWLRNQQGRGVNAVNESREEVINQSGTTLGCLEQQREHYLCHLECQNRWDTFAEEDEEELVDEKVLEPPGLGGQHVAVNKKKNKKMPRWPTKKGEMRKHTVGEVDIFCFEEVKPEKRVYTVGDDRKNNEVNAVQEEVMGLDKNGDVNETTIEVTIDSGASDSVLSERQAPNFTTVESAGSKRGVQYVSASGGKMPNRGEKHLKVETAEGHVCAIRLQVTDVSKALLSVGKICDAGHEVGFRKDGGVIRHLATGQETAFYKVDGVYRMKLKIVGDAAARKDFPRRER